MSRGPGLGDSRPGTRGRHFAEDHSPPAPEPPFSTSPPEEKRGPQQWGTSGGTDWGRPSSPTPTPTSQAPHSSPTSAALGRGLLRIHCCSGAHELCTGTRSIRQHPVREESKAPAAGRQLSLRREVETRLSRPVVGPPLRALRWPSPWALCSPPLPNAPSLCFSARHRFDKCL